MSRPEAAPREALRRDIAQGPAAPSAEEWRAFEAACTEVAFRKDDVVFEMAAVPDGLLFVTDGVAAAELALSDGRSLIYRFFERGQYCTTITSAWYETGTHDSITAVTDLAGVMLPFRWWREQYLTGAALGVYFRLKALENLLFAKDVIRVKTLNSTASTYAFLEERHADVIARVQQKDVARFIGVTPEGLSRFLKNRRR